MPRSRAQILFLNDSTECDRWLFPLNILIASKLLIKIRGNSECSQPVQRNNLFNFDTKFTSFQNKDQTLST